MNTSTDVKIRASTFHTLIVRRKDLDSNLTEQEFSEYEALKNWYKSNLQAGEFQRLHGSIVRGNVITQNTELLALRRAGLYFPFLLLKYIYFLVLLAVIICFFTNFGVLTKWLIFLVPVLHIFSNQFFKERALIIKQIVYRTIKSLESEIWKQD